VTEKGGDITMSNDGVLTEAEGRQFFDRAVREELGISGDEFLRRYDAGHYNGDDADPDLIGLIMLIPFARRVTT